MTTVDEAERLVAEAWRELWTPGNPTSETERLVDRAIRAHERASLVAALRRMAGAPKSIADLIESGEL